MLLAGDIGGTKTLLALFAPSSGARQPLAEAEFHSANYAGLDAIVREFLAREQRTVEYACFDVAGPVIGGDAYVPPAHLDFECTAGRSRDDAAVRARPGTGGNAGCLRALRSRGTGAAEACPQKR